MQSVAATRDPFMQFILSLIIISVLNGVFFLLMINYSVAAAAAAADVQSLELCTRLHHVIKQHDVVISGF